MTGDGTGQCPVKLPKPALFMGEQAGTDEVSALVSSRRICTDMSHFNLLFRISHAHLFILVI